MAIINYTEKWLYFMEPHTASRAVHDALVQVEGCQSIGPHHATLERVGTKTTNKDRLLGFDLICTVRNPLEILVKLWMISHGRFGPFDNWLTLKCAEEFSLSRLGGFWKHCNIICWYENLQQDLNFVLQQEVKLARNPEHETKNKQPWQAYYTDAMFDMAMEFCREFNKTFGYEIQRDGTVVLNESARRKRLKKVGYCRI